MTPTTISVQIPQARPAPRLATLIGEWVGDLLTALRSSTPAQRYPAQEAAQVRALAHQFEASDPRFAAELYAAADRHEALCYN